jgi:integrase
MNRNRRRFSYITGEKGRNRVRAFDDPRSGFLYLEVRSEGSKKRIALGHRNREAARAKADEVALRLRTDDGLVRHKVTLAELFDNYLREVTPTKSKGKQLHDKRVAALAKEVLGANRLVSQLTHRDAARFVQERRRLGDMRGGEQQGKPVGERIVGYDLTWIVSVFNWGARGGLLDRNPFVGYRTPRNQSPRRPVVTEEQYQSLLSVTATIDPLCRALLVLVHETGHRIGAVRHLRWSDVDLKSPQPRINWRAEADKIRHEHSTPLSDVAVQELQLARKARLAIGDGWLFPSPTDPKLPVSRHLVRDWWERMQKDAKLPAERGRGWHSLRRKFATELKNAPLRDLQALGGWKDPMTIVKCYQQPDDVTMAEALKNRTPLRSLAAR